MSRALSRVVAALAIACLFLASWTVPQSQAAVGPLTGYLMAHFTGESATGEQIYLAHSDDGLHWTDLNNGSPSRTTRGHVSFESVNFPGHYLRHQGYDFVLAANDGSAAFAADATFRVTT